MRASWGALFAGLVVLSGCGDQAVSRSTLQSVVSKQLAASAHRPAPKIDCPKDLPAKVGASESCVLTDTSAGNVRLPVHVQVDSVNGSHAHFQIQVGRTPLG